LCADRAVSGGGLDRLELGVGVIYLLDQLPRSGSEPIDVVESGGGRSAILSFRRSRS
jgi:hypothetical protein